MWYKHVNNRLPGYFADMFYTEPVTHVYNTRNKKPRAQIPKKKMSSCSLRYVLPSIVNSLPTSVTEKVYTHSLSGFNNYAKQYYISTYNDQCTIENCYICGR